MILKAIVCYLCLYVRPSSSFLNLIGQRTIAQRRGPYDDKCNLAIISARFGGLSCAAHQRGQYDDECDVAIIGAGIGGLSCAAILSAKYNQKVNVYESHYHAGGCAHSFEIKSKNSKATYNFDSGPTITLGCSAPPFNPLMQVLNSVGGGNLIDWIRYDSWGMVTEDGAWPFELGEGKFESGPLTRFGGPTAVEEFQNLRRACQPLCAGAAGIPTMTLRADRFRLLPLLPHMEALKAVIPYADILNGSFEPFMKKQVSDPWLKSWLNALAFSLSGLDASQTGAAALAYTLFDLHRPGAALDYPRGGFGEITNALVKVIEDSGGRVHLSSPVNDICVQQGRAAGIKLKSGKFVRAKRGVVCNAAIWALPQLLKTHAEALTPAQRTELITSPSSRMKTKSFMHLHLGIDSAGLDQSRMHAHYTVMDKGLHTADPCGDRNMVAVSNPSIIDPSLVSSSGEHMVLHAYGAGNEDFKPWAKLVPGSQEYLEAKRQGSAFLYQSVSRALGISESELKERTDVELVGSPLTHKRFLMREEGTYGAEYASMLPGPTTGLPGLFLVGDSTFPGIGVPAVAVSGANAANTMVSVARHAVGLMRG